MKDSDDDLACILDIELGNGVLTDEVKADVQSNFVRILAKVNQTSQLPLFNTSYIGLLLFWGAMSRKVTLVDR